MPLSALSQLSLSLTHFLCHSTICFHGCMYVGVWHLSFLHLGPLLAVQHPVTICVDLVKPWLPTAELWNTTTRSCACQCTACTYHGRLMTQLIQCHRTAPGLIIPCCRKLVCSSRNATHNTSASMPSPRCHELYDYQIQLWLSLYLVIAQTQTQSPARAKACEVGEGCIYDFPRSTTDPEVNGTDSLACSHHSCLLPNVTSLTYCGSSLKITE